MANTPTHFQENETPRIEAFSDGVFAIDITLLTFELKAPAFKEEYTSHTLLLALLAQWPMYLAYLLSFGTIFIIWVNHHRMFNVVRRSDSTFLYLNGLLLLLVSLIPFTTNILAKYIQTSATELSTIISMLLFGGITGTLLQMWKHATDNFHLLKRPAADVRIITVSQGLLISTSVYMIAALIALIFPTLSILISLAMIVYLARLKYHREKVV